MKVVLTAINAKYIHSNPAVYSLRAYAGNYLAIRADEPSGRQVSDLRADQLQIEILEFTINHDADKILQELYRARPTVLCFSCYIWNIRMVRELIRDYHGLCPDTPVWVGGPEVSYEAGAFLAENPAVSGVMIGEGEKTFAELCACGFRGELSGIRGILFREPETGNLIRTLQREPLSMDELPFYYDETADFSNRILYYESSRGCPFSCSYCLSSLEKHLRFRNLETVKKELLFFLERKVKQVKFVDRTFNCNHEHAREIWRFIREHDNGVTNFHFEISADLLDEEELALLAQMRPGLIQLEIGVQSTHETTIREIHRTTDFAKLKQQVLRIQENGNIHEYLDLIAGLPYEDYETFRHSFGEVYALKPEQLQLGFLKVLKGSYLYEHAAEYGIRYHAQAPYEVMSTNWLGYEDVIRIKQAEEMVEVYYNSGQFEVTVKLMECLFDDMFGFYQELGTFYEEKGYLAMSHSRLRRCEILLEFLQSVPVGCQADGMGKTAEAAFIPCIREALTFDLYYRENCKSRPSWAPPAEELREMTHRFCKNGKLSHVEPFHYRFPEKKKRTVQELPKRQETLWVLFDYENRDALNHQAAVTYINEEMLWQQNEQKKF